MRIGELIVNIRKQQGQIWEYGIVKKSTTTGMARARRVWILSGALGMGYCKTQKQSPPCTPHVVILLVHYSNSIILYSTYFYI